MTRERTAMPPAQGLERKTFNPFASVLADGLRGLIEPGARKRGTKSLLVYLHVPFCSSKCHFCDWVVGYSTGDLIDKAGDLRDAYTEALVRQIDAYAPMIGDLGYTVTNIYWGGGTPTRLSPRQIAHICRRLASHFPLDEVVEHTAECSPETLTAEHLAVWTEHGLNRLSMGVQSYDPQVLRRMGRSHSLADIDAGLGTIHAAGLTNFNIDLITGMAGQNADSSLAAVQRAIADGIPHISVYMFRDQSEELTSVRQAKAGHTVHDTREVRYAAYLKAKDTLEQAGYEEYIVGYFAREPRFRFDSEDYYFSIRGDYFGFGAGAGSVIGRYSLKSGEATRYGNSHVRDFIVDPTRMTGCALRHAPDVLFTDGFFKAFTTRTGIDFARWNDQFGFSFDQLCAARPGIARWLDERRSEGGVFLRDECGLGLSADTWLDTMIWRR